MGRVRTLIAAATAFAALAAFGWDCKVASAQAVFSGPYVSSYRISNYFGAPATYGMSYGFASYGMPQTYSVFSAFPGAAYGTNYPPYGILPGRFGVGLWRPGFVTAGYLYGATYYPNSLSYRTFPVGYDAGAPVSRNLPPPPVGLYAPALGPSTLYGW
jgi:hypothetical protein